MAKLEEQEVFVDSVGTKNANFNISQEVFESLYDG